MNTNFPVTRRALLIIEDWFVSIAQPFLPLKKVRAEGGQPGDFHWDFEEHSAKTAMIGKAVRIISGLRGTMMLADLGYVTECSALLRTIDDFIAEVDFLVDGLGSKEPSKHYDEFLRQYFATTPASADEYAKQPKQRWVARDKVIEGFVRSAGEITKDSDGVRKSLKFVSHTYDGYIHGGYLTAMELYSGATNRFMLGGHDGQLERDLANKMVASRLLHALATFANVATLLGDNDAMRNFCSGGIELADSGELP